MGSGDTGPTVVSGGTGHIMGIVRIAVPPWGVGLLRSHNGEQRVSVPPWGAGGIAVPPREWGYWPLHWEQE